MIGCQNALLLIEFHSRCRFHGSYGAGHYFHMQPDVERRSTIQQIQRWWKQNNMSTISEGIRNLLESGWEFGKIEMCQNLIELGNSQHVEFAKQQLVGSSTRPELIS